MIEELGPRVFKLTLHYEDGDVVEYIINITDLHRRASMLGDGRVVHNLCTVIGFLQMSYDVWKAGLISAVDLERMRQSYEDLLFVLRKVQ